MSDLRDISSSPDKEMNLRPSFVEAVLVAGAPHSLFSPHARTVILYSIHGERFSHIAAVCAFSTEHLCTAPFEPTAVTLWLIFSRPCNLFHLTVMLLCVATVSVRPSGATAKDKTTHTEEAFYMKLFQYLRFVNRFSNKIDCS